jgi:predicted transcriptional regulator
MELIILLALKCIHEQSDTGTHSRDLQFRVELNHYYLKQIVNYLLEDQLIYKIDPVDDQSLLYTTYYLTQKGHETYEKMKAKMEAIGVKPKLNGPRERPPDNNIPRE